MQTLDIQSRAWRDFVAGCPAALPYHHPAWATLLAECYGFHAFALAVSDSAGRITLGLPVIEIRHPLTTRALRLRGGRGDRRWLSLPFTDYCPPLLAAGAPAEEIPALLEDTRRAAGVATVQVRAAVPGGCVSPGAVTHTLALDPDPAAVYRRFHRSQVQRNIARAERSGLQVRRAQSVDDLAGAFYELHLRTRRRQGTPVQPRRFFRLLWERVIAQGLGHVLLAYHGRTPVAGAVFLTWAGTTIYKYGASDEASWSLRPNHLIFWTAIQDACRRGDNQFDLGRTDLDNAGLRAFKGSWGAQESPLVYSSFPAPLAPAAPPSPPAPPARLERALGTVIRRSPPWVCRLLGEALYRYAA